MAELLSIVIAAESGLEKLSDCLRSLPVGEPLDVHVAVAGKEQAAPEGVRLHRVAGWPSRPRLRAAAMEAATGDAVAVLNEDYTVGDGWTSAVRETARHGAEVVCGEVDPPAGVGAARRAAYLWEYAHLLGAHEGQLSDEEARWVPAGCVVYRGRARDAVLLAGAGSELDYHRAMANAGIQFFRDRSLRVVYHPPGLGRFLRNRKRWSYEWVKGRMHASPPRSRVAAALLRTPLPALLLARIGLRLVRLPRFWGVALVSLPLFAAFAAAQTVGEMEACLKAPYE